MEGKHWTSGRTKGGIKCKLKSKIRNVYFHDNDNIRKCLQSNTTDPIDFTLFGAREVIRYSHHHFAFQFPGYQKNWQVVWKIFVSETPMVALAWHCCLQILHLLQPQQQRRLLPVIKIQPQFRSNKYRSTFSFKSKYTLNAVYQRDFINNKPILGAIKYT